MDQSIIVFDTETTGLPRSKIINSETLHLWPHVVQFSYVMYNVGQMKMEKVKDVVVKIPETIVTVSYTHLRAHETLMNLVCRLLLEKNFFF